MFKMSEYRMPAEYVTKKPNLMHKSNVPSENHVKFSKKEIEVIV